ncbi:MFS transporter [Mycolicibacterium agri]|nr:MFS transporter [Mycolicibacterium agri]
MLSLVYMSLTSWSVAVNELADSFALSPGAIQVGSAALIAGYAIGGFFQGKWIPRFGWRRVFLVVITAFLIASALIPVVPSYPVILLLRFVQGWGCMVVLMCAILSAWFPVKKRGLAIGILLGAIGLGSALGGYITGILNPIMGWQNTFWVITAITVVGAVAFLLIVDDAPPLEEEAATAADTAGAGGRSVYADPRLWLLGAATFCCFFNCYGMYAYLAQYLYSVGFTSAAVGTVVLVNGLIAVVSTPFGGWFSDRLVPRLGPLRARTFTNAWVAMFVGAVGCVLIPHLAPLGFGLALLTAAIAGWGIPATNGPGLSLPSDLLGSKAAGPAVGLVILIAGSGGIIAPAWVPMLAASHGWTLGWYITAAAAVIGLVINLILGTRGGSNMADVAAGERARSNV